MAVWLAALSLGAGTAAGCGKPPSALALGLALLGAVVVSLRRSWMRPAGLAMLCVGGGALNAAWRCEPRTAVGALTADVPMCALSGRVLERAGGLGTLVAADVLDCEGYERTERAGVVILDGAVGHTGSRVTGRGWLVPLRAEGFDAARRRAGAQGYFDATSIRSRRPRSPPYAVAAAIREGLLRATDDLDARRGALLAGLAIGDDSELDALTIETFRATGLSHLLAVSGSNVAIVLATVAAVTASLGLRLRLGFAAAGLGLFVLVVGPEPSVLRAAVMGAIGLCVLATGRRAEPLHLLGLALAVLLALRPAIVFSVGLHLSAAATAGIVLWAPAIAARLRPVVGRPMALALAATLAAQAAVAPVLIGVFGDFSIVAPVANLLAVPAVAPATILGLSAGVIGSFHQAAGSSIGRLAEPFAAWILWVADLFATGEWASLEVPHRAGAALAVPVIVLAVLTARRLEGGRASGKVAAVTYRWTLHGLRGEEIRTTERFETQAQAESWLGDHWPELLDDGAENVSLVTDDGPVYRMGLRPA